MDPHTTKITLVNEAPRVVIWRDAKRATLSTVRDGFDQIETIANGCPVHLICDLSKSVPPGAETRREIKMGMDKLEKNNELASLGIYVGDNYIIKIAASFIIKIMKYKVEIYESIDLAIESIKEKYDVG